MQTRGGALPRNVERLEMKADAGIQGGKKGFTEVTKLIETRMHPNMVNGTTSGLGDWS